MTEIEHQDRQKVRVDIKAKLQYEALKELALQGQTSFIISALNGGLVYFALRVTGDEQTVLLWFISLLSVTAARALLITWFFKQDEQSPRLGLWRNFYFLAVYCSALLWGVLPLFDIFLAEAWAQTFIIFVIAGMSAGALVALYASLLATIPYLILILLPLAFVLSQSNQPSYLAMTALCGLYLLMLVRSSYSLNQRVHKRLRLELENTELLDFLVTKRDQNNEANDQVFDRSELWKDHEK